MSYNYPSPAAGLPSDPPPAYPGDEKFCQPGYPPSTAQQPPYTAVSTQYYNQQTPSYGLASPADGVYCQPSPTTAEHIRVMTQQPVYVSTAVPIFTVRQRARLDPESFCSVLLSCFVCWFCCCPLGFVALVLAMMAKGLSTNSTASAAKLRRASLSLSLTGIVVGLLLVVLMGAFKTSRSWHYEPYKCPWLINGSCFTVRDEFPLNDYMNRSCATGAIRQFNYCYHNGSANTLGKAPAYNLEKQLQLYQ